MDFNIIDESGMSAGDIETTRLALIEYLKPLAPWNFGNSIISTGSGGGGSNNSGTAGNGGQPIILFERVI